MIIRYRRTLRDHMTQADKLQEKFAHRRKALRPHDDGYSVIEKWMKVLLVIATFMLMLIVGVPR